MPETVEIDWKLLQEVAGPYPPEAFVFVQHGLRATVEQLRTCDPDMPENGRHVTGQELCLGLRDYAIDRYGMLAGLVLERWNIKRTEDFGRIVFGMVEAGLLRKTDEDRFEDFQGVFDFQEAFGQLQLG